MQLEMRSIRTSEKVHTQGNALDEPTIDKRTNNALLGCFLSSSTMNRFKLRQIPYVR